MLHWTSIAIFHSSLHFTVRVCSYTISPGSTPDLPDFPPIFPTLCYLLCVCNKVVLLEVGFNFPYLWTTREYMAQFPLHVLLVYSPLHCYTLVQILYVCKCTLCVNNIDVTCTCTDVFTILTTENQSGGIYYSYSTTGGQRFIAVTGRWKCISSAQSENLHNLEIALCILRILRLCSNFEIAQHVHNLRTLNFAWQWVIYCVACKMKDIFDACMWHLRRIAIWESEQPKVLRCFVLSNTE